MKHRLSKTTRATAAVALLITLLFTLLPALRGDDAKQAVAPAADGVFFRVRVAEPADQPWLAKIGGHIHVDPWSMVGAGAVAGDGAPAAAAAETARLNASCALFQP